MTAEKPLYVSAGDGFNPATAAAILPVSAPVLTSPFVGVNIPYQLTQNFQCHASRYQPLPLNTKWGSWAGAVPADYDGFILCAESPREDIGGQTVRWTRTYAKVPTAFSTAGSTTYSFIGFQSASGINVPISAGRPRRTRPIDARIYHEFFLLDPNTNLKSPTDVGRFFPVDEQRYFLNKDVVGMFLETDLLTSVNIDSNPTVPSVEDYLAWIAAKIEIIAQVSNSNNWLGNIVERQTVYILPQ